MFCFQVPQIVTCTHIVTYSTVGYDISLLCPLISPPNRQLTKFCKNIHHWRIKYIMSEKCHMTHDKMTFFSSHSSNPSWNFLAHAAAICPGYADNHRSKQFFDRICHYFILPAESIFHSQFSFLPLGKILKKKTVLVVQHHLLLIVLKDPKILKLIWSQ